ncbi:hypothetical protein K3495_g966 [Podosphaera aphanis]|nr:hypothetical protein K3495_g966 [Podosphaera aphanis]
MTLPLNAASPLHQHVLQSLSLLVLALLFIPFNTFFAVLSVVLTRINSLAYHLGLDVPKSSNLSRQHAEPQRTILVTGVGMAKGLHIARAFYLRGHTVIGADAEPWKIPVNGRFSCALKKYERLPIHGPEPGAKENYIATIVDIVRRNSVDLWVSCSGLASAMEDAEAAEYVERETNCRVFQFGVDLTRTLHEKDLFIDQARNLGLNVPETHPVTSVEQVMKILYPSIKDISWKDYETCSTEMLMSDEKFRREEENLVMAEGCNETEKRKRYYLMKSVFIEDSVRTNMTPLPKSTIRETLTHVSLLKPSPSRLFVLQQYLAGGEYTTHSIVIQGKVVAFTACPSKDLTMHYKALPPSSPISCALQKYTELFAGRTGRLMTGHLSIDFLLDAQQEIGKDDVDDLMARFYPIECNPRAHTAVVLFQENSLEMADAYLSLLDGDNTITHKIVRPTGDRTYHWVGQDLVTEVFLPVLEFFTGSADIFTVLKKWEAFVDLLIAGREGTWCVWDPWPAWWLYSVYWPVLLSSVMLSQTWWSRCNVSTGRVYVC